MTVSSATYKADTTGNGVTTEFSIPFELQDESQVLVTKVSSTGIETVLVLNTDYTVSDIGTASRKITLTTPLPSGERVIRTPNMALTQSADYVEGDDFAAETHEGALDKLTLICQQFQEQLDRTVKLSVSSADDIDTLITSTTEVAAVLTELVTVAGISTDVTSVAGISSDVVTAAGISTDITNVAGIEQDILAVPGLAQAAADSAAAAAAAMDGKVDGPVSSVSGNLVYFDSADGGSVADTGLAFVDLKNMLDNAPIYATAYGVVADDSSSPVAQNNVTALLNAHNAALAANKDLMLPDGSVYLESASTVEVELGATILEISNGVEWDCEGLCLIHSSGISATPEIRFQATVPSGHSGVLSQVGFRITKNIHFISDAAGVQIELGRSTDFGNQIYYNRTYFGASIRSNTDNASNVLFRAYSVFGLDIAGQVINAGATTPAVGSTCIEVLDSNHCKFTGTCGGSDIGIDLTNGTSNSGFLITGNFENQGTNLVTDASCFDVEFRPQRCGAFDQHVDAQGGVGCLFDPLSFAQEAHGVDGLKSTYVPINITNNADWLELDGDDIRRDGAFTKTFDASNNWVSVKQIPVPEDSWWRLDIDVAMALASSGFEGFNFSADARVMVARPTGGDVSVNGNTDVYHVDEGVGTMDVQIVAVVPSQAIDIQVKGSASSTYQVSYSYLRTKLKR